MFRRFKWLAARNILHMQARLTTFEQEIDELDKAAWQSKDKEINQSSRRWETLMTNDACKHRMDKLNDLKSLLKEYCKSTM
jgi:hypothetical protein